MAVETITTVLIAAQAATQSAESQKLGIPAPSPYDLTDLATIKDELTIQDDDTSNDSFLQRAITQASVKIGNYCNRIFQLEAIQDQIYIQRDPYPYQVPGGVYPLQLSRWPLVPTGAVTFTANTHNSPVIDGIASTAGITEGSLIFSADGSIPAGTTVQSMVSPTTLLLTQSAKGSKVGVSMTVGMQVTQTLSPDSTQTLVYGQDYTIDAKRGWLIRLNAWTAISTRWEADPVTVQYQAGYAPIPADLVECCIRLVTARFRAKGRDPLLVERTQPGIGVERYWVGSSPGQKGSMPPDIEALLDQYRVPVIS